MQILKLETVTYITEWCRAIIAISISGAMHIIVHLKRMTIAIEVSAIAISFGITDHSLAFVKIDIGCHHSIELSVATIDQRGKVLPVGYRSDNEATVSIVTFREFYCHIII